MWSYGCSGFFLLLSARTPYNGLSYRQTVQCQMFRKGSMPMIGKTPAHYEITSQLGRDRMERAYQAKDQKLGREVAIGVLPEDFTDYMPRIGVIA
jgi:hypothetical protein